jgi:arylesterase/paraoxonase
LEEDVLKPLTLQNFNVNDFHPVGIHFEASTSTLYVVNHAQSGSAIEVFHLSIKSSTATHALTLKHPLISTPNSIHALGSGKFFFTNDHYIRAAVSPLLSKIETFSGAPGGSVVFFDINDFSAAKTVARVPFANGIAMINESTLVVASSSKSGVYFYNVTPEYDLGFKTYVRTQAAVDNLSVDGKGTLLMAGHPFSPSLMKFARNRWMCDMEGGEKERRACECGAPSWAAEWTEAGGLKEIYKGSEICSSTTVVRDTTRGVGIVCGLYDRGILVFRE